MPLNGREQYYTYESAPSAPELRGMGITTRQLHRWGEQGKLTIVKIGNRVLIPSSSLRELVERSTFKSRVPDRGPADAERAGGA